MKKLISLLLLAALCLSAFAVTAFADEADPSLEEGYVRELEGCTSEVRWCKNGEQNIFGRFYYPADFDPEQSYPVVIMSHGLGSTCDMTEKMKWPQAVTAAGFVAYAYDFCGGSKNSKSDGDFFQMSVRTEQSDLSAVMDFVKEQSFVDSKQLFLLGQSQGGFVSAITAAARPDEVKAMVLVYPALCLVDDLHTFVPDLSALTGETFESAMGELGVVYARDGYDIDVMAEIAGYPGDVMVIHGLNDKVVPYTYSVEAVTNAYSAASSELVLITGKKSAHGFEMVYNEGRDYAEGQAVSFLCDHVTAVS